MNVDTPLIEVARMLPTEGARCLMDTDELTQQTLLRGVRTFVVVLEEQGVTLDPLDFSVVVNTFISSMMASVNVINDLHRELTRTQADLLLERSSRRDR